MKAIFRSVWRCIALSSHCAFAPATTETRLRNGATIVCANHVSFVDGLIIALASPVPPDLCLHTDFARQSRGARFGMGVMARMGFGGVVPVDEGHPFGIRTLRKALLQGESVMIFPEGMISMDGQPNPLQPGLAWLETQTRAPVAWLQITGAEQSRIFAKSGRALWPRIDLEF